MHSQDCRLSWAIASPVGCLQKITVTPANALRNSSSSVQPWPKELHASGWLLQPKLRSTAIWGFIAIYVLLVMVNDLDKWMVRGSQSGFLLGSGLSALPKLYLSWLSKRVLLQFQTSTLEAQYTSSSDSVLGRTTLEARQNQQIFRVSCHSTIDNLTPPKLFQLPFLGLL